MNIFAKIISGLLLVILVTGFVLTLNVTVLINIGVLVFILVYLLAGFLFIPLCFIESLSYFKLAGEIQDLLLAIGYLGMLIYFHIFSFTLPVIQNMEIVW